MDLKSKIILIYGPTASGKSKFAIKLAKKIKGEILNADSMQVYKELKILTARPLKSNFQKIKHHLYGFCDVRKKYSHKEITNSGSTILWKNTLTYRIIPQKEPLDLTKEDMNGIRMVKSLKYSIPSYTHIMEDTTWEFPMQELTPYKLDVTSSTDIPMIVKKPQSNTSMDHTWHIVWDV